MVNNSPVWYAQAKITLGIVLKKLIFICAVIALSGCKDSKTGLDKSFINSSVDACIRSLTDNLKSPSSLKLSKIVVDFEPATKDEIYEAEFLDLSNVSAVANKYETLSASGYKGRAFTIVMEYEAQNSYGAMIRGYSGCKLVGNDKSADTFKIIHGEDESMLFVGYSPEKSFLNNFTTPKSAQGIQVEVASLGVKSSDLQKNEDSTNLKGAMKRRMDAFSIYIQSLKKEVVELKSLKPYATGNFVNELSRKIDVAQSKLDSSEIEIFGKAVSQPASK